MWSYGCVDLNDLGNTYTLLSPYNTHSYTPSYISYNTPYNALYITPYNTPYLTYPSDTPTTMWSYGCVDLNDLGNTYTLSRPMNRTLFSQPSTDTLLAPTNAILITFNLLSYNLPPSYNTLLTHPLNHLLLMLCT